MTLYEVVTPFTYNNVKEPKEIVIPGDLVRPDESMTIREILDRFQRGVPCVGVSHTDFDVDPEAIMNDDYVFPDFPELCDYVYAEKYLQRLKQEKAEQAAAERAAQQAAQQAQQAASNGGGPANAE